ncbi:MAG: hypothetical protein FJ265_05595 [Planctomycetes bacterium]|nr:hypothetical protein [Planctomycetota bacterium]
MPFHSQVCTTPAKLPSSTVRRRVSSNAARAAATAPGAPVAATCCHEEPFQSQWSARTVPSKPP